LNAESLIVAYDVKIAIIDFSLEIHNYWDRILTTAMNKYATFYSRCLFVCLFIRSFARLDLDWVSISDFFFIFFFGFDWN
jgi:hypothetical protein